MYACIAGYSWKSQRRAERTDSEVILLSLLSDAQEAECRLSFDSQLLGNIQRTGRQKPYTRLPGILPSQLNCMNSFTEHIETGIYANFSFMLLGNSQSDAPSFAVVSTVV